MNRDGNRGRGPVVTRTTVDPRIRAALQPSEALATHFGSLAMQVREWAADQLGLLAIGVLGVGRGVGASTVAFNLAVSLARGLNEPRVVLVEADWASSYTLKSVAPGLSEGLLGRANLNDCLLETGLDGMKLLPRGEVSAKEALQLPWGNLQECLQRDLAAFDILVFDLPNLESMTLCQAVSSQLAGVLAVNESGDPRIRQLTNFRQRLQTFPVQFVGRIVNKAID